jgi:hypothetical protein
MEQSTTEYCEWQYDHEEDFYETACNNGFLFEIDGIIENEFNFCPYYGKPIKEIK